MSELTTNYNFIKPALSDEVAQTMGADIPTTFDLMDTALKALSDILTALQATVTLIGTDLDTAESDIDDAETDISTNASAISTIQSNITTIQGQITTINNTLATLTVPSADDITAGTLDLDIVDIQNSDISVRLRNEGLTITGGKVSVKNDNNIDILTSKGINPYLFDYFKNMVTNSGFEVFDASTLKPAYWDGAGVSDPNSSYYENYSCKLTSGQYIETHADNYINPSFFDNDEGRLSFHRKSGQMKVEVYDVTNAGNLTLTDEDGNTGSSITFSANSNWQSSRVSVNFDPTELGASTALKIKISNVHGSETGYLDAVMMTPDFGGTYPQLYRPGVKSFGVEGSLQGVVSGTSEPTDTDNLWVDTNPIT